MLAMLLVTLLFIVAISNAFVIHHKPSFSSRARGQGQILNSGSDLAQASELNRVIGTLSDSQKYELVLQSYGNSILSGQGPRNETAYRGMVNLYKEMIEKRVQPSQRASSLMVSAASSTYSCSAIGEALRLCIAGGQLRTFGRSTFVTVFLVHRVMSCCRSGHWSTEHPCTD